MSTTVVVARNFRGQTLYLTSAEHGAFCWSCFKDRALPVSVEVAKRIITEAQGYKADAYAEDRDGNIIIPLASGAAISMTRGESARFSKAQRVPPLTCQCEHDKHFLPLPGERVHAYNAVAEDVQPFKTPFATLNACAYCRDNCLAIYKEARS